jgi:hypothetical protein
MNGNRLLAAAALLAALAPSLAADRVITHDNRILECKKAREKDGGYVLQFEHGEIVLPDKGMVKAVEIEGDMSEYVPQNEDEKKKLEQGFVKYRGRWMSKPAYEDELTKQAAASKKRADEIAAHSEWSNAWTKETKHFVFTTNTSPELLDYYSELLETYYSLMDGRFGIKPSPTLKRTKMAVKIYKSKKDFHTLSGMDEQSVMGFFDRAAQELHFYHNYAEPSQTEWVALHECTHLLTYLIEPQYIAYPEIWLNEAVADYFGSSAISRDKKGKLVIEPGVMQNDRILTVQGAIAAGNDTKLEELFRIPKDDFDGFQYAHGWSFVYFLNEARPDYKKAFDKFFKDIYTQAKGIAYKIEAVPANIDKSGRGALLPPDEMKRVVLSALKVKDLDALEKEWKTWIGSLELEGPEARFKRAYVQVIYGRMLEGVEDREGLEKNVKAAIDDLNAAIEGGMATARAFWTRSRALSWMRLTGKDRDSFEQAEEAAKADLRKAIELDPLASQYYWDLGNLLHRGMPDLGDEEDAGEGGDGGSSRPLGDEARKFLGLATELAPENEERRTRFLELSGA